MKKIIFSAIYLLFCLSSCVLNDTVVDEKGQLWIAKFPSKNDDNNTGAWEKVVHDLARMCELNVPESKLETFSKLGSTFLVKRFDRIGSKRIHFASAMTLLGKSDGANASDGTSYLDLAHFIKASLDYIHISTPNKVLVYQQSIINL